MCECVMCVYVNGLGAPGHGGSEDNLRCQFLGDLLIEMGSFVGLELHYTD